MLHVRLLFLNQFVKHSIEPLSIFEIHFSSCSDQNLPQLLTWRARNKQQYLPPPQGKRCHSETLRCQMEEIELMPRTRVPVLPSYRRITLTLFGSSDYRHICLVQMSAPSLLSPPFSPQTGPNLNGHNLVSFCTGWAKREQQLINAILSATCIFKPTCSLQRK